MNTLNNIKVRSAMNIAKRNRLPKDYFVKNIQFEFDNMLVILKSGYVMVFDLVEFPRLLNASEKQRENWELIGQGIGIHWDEIDEDISVEGLIKSYIALTSKFTKNVQKLVAV